MPKTKGVDAPAVETPIETAPASPPNLRNVLALIFCERLVSEDSDRMAVGDWSVTYLTSNEGTLPTWSKVYPLMYAVRKSSKDGKQVSTEYRRVSGFCQKDSWRAYAEMQFRRLQREGWDAVATLPIMITSDAYGTQSMYICETE